MADRMGPVPPGRHQGQGGARPPGAGGQGRYDYGVPNDDGPFVQQGAGNRYDGANGNGGGYDANGGWGNGSSGNGGYPGGYDYSEPFDYFGRSAGRAPAVMKAPTQAPPSDLPVWEPDDNYYTGETLQLGALSLTGTLPGRESRDEALGIPSGPSEGRAVRRRAARRAKRRRRLSITKEIPILVGVALFIALVLKTFLVQAFVIPSGSMEQTIRVGDRVLVDKLTPWFGSKPERGDVVVFKDPGGWLPESEKRKDDPPGVRQGKQFMTFIGLLPSDDEQDLIKRVVGMGGDNVKCCDKQGKVTVNGKPVEEPYVFPGNKPSQIKFDVTVPVGRVFVLGDHRSSSADSRFHLRDKGDGSVPEELLVGRAVVIAWPFDHWTKLEDAGAYSSVPAARGSASAAPAAGDSQVTQSPIPAELPLVMGVVGLSRLSGGRQWTVVRSECGGPGGRRSFRFRRRRWRRGSGRQTS